MERIRRSVVWCVFAVLLVGFTVSTQAIEIFKEAEDAYTNAPGWPIAGSGYIVEFGNWKTEPQWSNNYGTLGNGDWLLGIPPAVGNAVSWNINVPSEGIYLVQLGVENAGNTRGNLDVDVDGVFVGEIVVTNLQQVDDPDISGRAYSVLRPFMFGSFPFPGGIGMMRTAVGSAGVVDLTAGVHNVEVTVTGPTGHTYIDYIRLTSVDDAYDMGYADGEAALLAKLPPGIRNAIEKAVGFGREGFTGFNK